MASSDPSTDGPPLVGTLIVVHGCERCEHARSLIESSGKRVLVGTAKSLGPIRKGEPRPSWASIYPYLDEKGSRDPLYYDDILSKYGRPPSSVTT